MKATVVVNIGAGKDECDDTAVINKEIVNNNAVTSCYKAGRYYTTNNEVEFIRVAKRISELFQFFSGNPQCIILAIHHVTAPRAIHFQAMLTINRFDIDLVILNTGVNT